MHERKRPEDGTAEPPTVEIMHPSYQPSKAELEEDLRVEASFDEAVEALTRPGSIRYIGRPKSLSVPIPKFAQL